MSRMIRRGFPAAFLAAFVLAAGIVAVGTRAGAQQPINPADFQPTITNPLFPLSLVGLRVLEGIETDPDSGATITKRLESRVLARTEIVAGVRVTVLEERAYENGELVEVALDYYAQHRDGSVYYFGELVDNYQDGRVRNHNGQWLAGVVANMPGIIMQASPKVGQTYRQELAPGVAEDMATVLSVNETVAGPAGTYVGCIKTREFTPLEPDLEEFKWHCPGVGLTQEQGPGFLTRLVALSTVPAPGATVQQPTAGSTTWPSLPDITLQKGGPPESVIVSPPSAGDGGLAAR